MSLRGMKDILPPETHLWAFLEESLKKISKNFGFDEIRTPILESSQLFHRGVGENTDIVEKEMYSFIDKGGESVSMRPEGTAPVVRSLNEQSWFRAHPVSKLFYLGPMFRYERPQKGRFRQFHQFGIELLGVKEATADVEVISFFQSILDFFDLKNVELHISSVGTEACRVPYKKKLIQEIEKIKDKIPQEFHKRIQSNPMRVFDLKDEKAQEATQNLPFLIDHLCSESQSHFEELKSGLELLNIPYKINPRIVRGLDYYNKTAFEFISTDLGAQSTVCGGGRYDKLVSELGGPEVPAVGFGLGIERLVLMLSAQGFKVDAKNEISIIYADAEGYKQSMKLAYELRKKGYSVDIDLQSKNIKNQFKRADKMGSRYALVIGEEEIATSTVVIKDLNKQTQEKVIFKDIENKLRQLVQK